MEPIIGQGAAAADLIKDGDTASFAADVLDSSRERPVIVDFWAPWCEPCKTLGPALEKAVQAAAGAVRLVKINVDENQELAQQLRVQSIPAVFAFHQGQPVDGFAGAVPESQIKDFIHRLSQRAGGSPVDDALEQAQTAFEAADYDTAAQIYSQVLQVDAENVAAVAGLAQCLIKDGDFDTARQMLDGLPKEMKEKADIASAIAALDLAEQAGNVGDMGPFMARLEADEDDHEARFELAKGLAAMGRREEAVDNLLEIIRRDRMWNEEAARSHLLTLFEAFGMTDPLTMDARRRLSAMLFS